MTDEEIRWVFAHITPEQQKLIDYYCENESKRIRRIGQKIWLRLGVPSYEYDDLCDDAIKVLVESITYYDPKKKIKFSTYLTVNITKSALDWYRDNYFRAKRNNLLIKNKKIVKDEDGNPIFLPNVRMDVENEDGINIRETIADQHTTESQLFNDANISEGSLAYKYLMAVAVDQREVALMLYNGYKPKEIRDILHMTERQYYNIMQGLRAWRNKKILKGL